MRRVQVPMPREELEARAHDRAMDVPYRLRRVPGRQGVYTLRSKTDPSVHYTLVYRRETNIAACTCKGYYYRGSCWHVERLRDRIARERTGAYWDRIETLLTERGYVDDVLTDEITPIEKSIITKKLKRMSLAAPV